ncbi:MAG: hypothetical protein DMF66_17780 [Acidobacteria bacterium]|nr:MAG: hypothetical protein DMF66_17780 [Acidobacteriota bacterium]
MAESARSTVRLMSRPMEASDSGMREAMSRTEEETRSRSYPCSPSPSVSIRSSMGSRISGSFGSFGVLICYQPPL